MSARCAKQHLHKGARGTIMVHVLLWPMRRQRLCGQTFARQQLQPLQIMWSPASQPASQPATQRVHARHVHRYK